MGWKHKWVETLQCIWHLASSKGGIIRYVTKMQEAEHILLAKYAQSFTAGLQESLPAGANVRQQCCFTLFLTHCQQPAEQSTELNSPNKLCIHFQSAYLNVTTTQVIPLLQQWRNDGPNGDVPSCLGSFLNLCRTHRDLPPTHWGWSLIIAEHSL